MFSSNRGVPVALLVPLLVLLIGCSAGGEEIAQYNGSSGRTLYQTGTITVAQQATQSFASSTSITMRAVASCDGKSCTPKRASLIFSVEGTSELTLSNRTLSINSDGEKRTWENQSSGYRRNSQIGRTEGRLAKIVMPISELSEMASAQSLTGTLGEKSLNLMDAKSELRNFVAATKGDKYLKTGNG